MLYDENIIKAIIEEFNLEFDFDGKTENFLPSFSKNMIIDGIGTVAVMYNGEPEITKKLVILALRTHNSFVLIPKINDDENSKIVGWINETCKKNNLTNFDISLDPMTHNTFFGMQKSFNMLLVIGAKKDYTSLLPHLSINSIFYQYGEYNIFIDKGLSLKQKAVLKKIDEIAFENDFIINYIDIPDFETKNNKQIEDFNNIIKNINYNGKSQTVCIFTPTKERSYYIINSLVCSQICINNFSFETLEFDENDFVCKKEIIF